jgi:hypothetical protein
MYPCQTATTDMAENFGGRTRLLQANTGRKLRYRSKNVPYISLPLHIHECQHILWDLHTWNIFIK